jgi:hypothetical protein
MHVKAMRTMRMDGRTEEDTRRHGCSQPRQWTGITGIVPGNVPDVARLSLSVRHARPASTWK